MSKAPEWARPHRSFFPTPFFGSNTGITDVKRIALATLMMTMTLALSEVAVAQYGEIVPIRPNYRGQPACPTDYVIQDNYCISIYSRRFRGDYGGSLPRPRGYGPVVEPWVNPYGQLQCPTDYVLDRAGNCVSIYARRRYN